MLDVAIGWLLANPLASVCALAAFAIGFGALLTPRVHDLMRHNHPRC